MPISRLFSIIIPTYNRPQHLTNCLAAIAQLDYAKDNFEVIVVDDGSQLDLSNTVKPFDTTLKLTLISQANQGPGAARNTGATQAQGEYLVFTDDDCLPAPDLLKQLAKQLELTPNYLIGGQVINQLVNNRYSTASQMLMEYVCQHLLDKPLMFFTTNNICVPRKFFRQIGGFDKSFSVGAEDREFCYRWLNSGYKMVYAPAVKVFHAHNLNFYTFCRQQFNYGRGSSYFHYVRAKQPHTPIKPESKRFYLDLLLYPLKQPSPFIKLNLVALMFISQVATTFGFFQERLVSPKRVSLKSPTEKVS